MIGDAFTLDRHDTQQFLLGRPLPAPHARAFRAVLGACAGTRPARHSSVYLPAPTPARVGRHRTVVSVLMSTFDTAQTFRAAGRTGCSVLPAGPWTGPLGGAQQAPPTRQASRYPAGCRSASR
jgi:hypothetical protein